MAIVDTFRVLEEIIRLQHGVISNKQALEAGMTRDAIRARLQAGRWRPLYRGVYATFTGPLTRDAQIWAALLAAGAGAVVSHETAAELWRLAEPSTSIHITVPVARRVIAPTGVVVHRSNRLPGSAHPIKSPPRTRVEETVLDLADHAKTADEVIGWLSTACVRGLTTAAHLSGLISVRSKMRWRDVAMAAISDVREGCQSPLEVRYLRDVEAAHGLPAAHRQRPDERVGGGQIYNDVRYEEFGLVIELDGRVNHPFERRFADLKRDNSAGVRGDSVLHFGWNDVAVTPCVTADHVACSLRNRGWLQKPRRCGRKCTIMEI